MACQKMQNFSSHNSKYYKGRFLKMRTCSIMTIKLQPIERFESSIALMGKIIKRIRYDINIDSQV